MLMHVKEAIRDVENKVDVAEIFSPPRATQLAQIVGLAPGLAMDWTTGWDFDLESHRDTAEKYVRVVKPLLTIGSPECRMFSTLQSSNKARFG